MSSFSRIENSLFSNFYSNGKGGVISNNVDQQIQVTNCFFSYVSASCSGGVIYGENGALLLNKCSFSFCRTTFMENNNGGNIIRSLNCDLRCTFFTSYKSWYSYESGDSCIQTDGGEVQCIDGNTTHCTHLKKWSGILYEIELATKVITKYFLLYGGDCCRGIYFTCVEGFEKIINHLSIVNTTVEKLIETDVSQIVEDSCFYNNIVTKSPFVEIIISDCYGDFEYEGLTKTINACAFIKNISIGYSKVICTVPTQKRILIICICLMTSLFIE